MELSFKEMEKVIVPKYMTKKEWEGMMLEFTISWVPRPMINCVKDELEKRFGKIFDKRKKTYAVDAHSVEAISVARKRDSCMSPWKGEKSEKRD
jgi:hypothetical protein